MPQARQGARAILGAIGSTVNDKVWFATAEITDVRLSDRMVRVSILPEGIETKWIRMLQPLAGQDYGISVLPEVGTEVGVLFVGANPNYGYVIGSLHDDDDTIPDNASTWGLVIKPKTGGFIKIDSEGIEINSDQKVVVNCDDCHFGDETGSHILTVDTFLPKYNADMAALALHTNYIAPDATIATIGNASDAHATSKTKAK